MGTVERASPTRGWVLPRWYYGWTVVAIAFLTLSAALGTRASFAVLLVPVADSFGWGRGVTAGALSLQALMRALCSVPVGAALDRWPSRWVFAGAAAIAGIGLALAALAREPWQLYLTFGLLAGVGLAAFQINSQAVVIANWFVSRRGLAIGIVTAGIGLGMLVLVPTTQMVVSLAGWRAAFLGLAAVFVLGIVPLNILAQRDRPADGAPGLNAEARRPASDASPGLGVREILGQRRFWALGLGALLGILPAHLLMTHVVAYEIDLGFTPAQAATALGISGAGAAGGILLLGYVADRWSGEWAWTIGLAGLMASIGLLYWLSPTRPVLLYGFALTFAPGLAASQGLISVLGVALAEGRGRGALMGLTGVYAATGGALGPALGGWLFDHTGSYQSAFVLALASSAAAILCIWLAAPRRGPLAAPSGPAAHPAARRAVMTAKAGG